MKVAITGISSYLASEIMPLLLKDPQIEEVLGIDLVPPNFKDPKLRFHKSDVRNPDLAEILRGIDTLIHLAFIVSPLKNVKEIYSINIGGSKNVFECAIQTGIEKIVHASSVAAYGSFPDNPIPISEEQPIRLMEKPYYYHETKYVVEKFISQLEMKHAHVKFVRLRPHIFLGPTINNPFRNMFSGSKLFSFFPDQPSQYVWAADVAQAFHLALKKDVSGAFNLGADDPISSYELAERLDKKLVKLPYRFSLAMLNLTYKLHLQRKLDPGWLRMARYPIIVDCSKAKEVLGWKPKYNTWNTIKAFISCLEESEEP